MTHAPIPLSIVAFVISVLIYHLIFKMTGFSSKQRWAITLSLALLTSIHYVLISLSEAYGFEFATILFYITSFMTNLTIFVFPLSVCIGIYLILYKVLQVTHHDSGCAQAIVNFIHKFKLHYLAFFSFKTFKQWNKKRQIENNPDHIIATMFAEAQKREEADQRLKESVEVLRQISSDHEEYQQAERLHQLAREHASNPNAAPDLVNRQFNMDARQNEEEGNSVIFSSQSDHILLVDNQGHETLIDSKGSNVRNRLHIQDELAKHAAEAEAAATATVEKKDSSYSKFSSANVDWENDADVARGAANARERSKHLDDAEESTLTPLEQLEQWFSATSLLAFVVLAFMALYSTFQALTLPDVRGVRVALDVPAEFDGMKIVQLSDLNLGSVYDKRRSADIVNKVLGLRPDIIVITGDLAYGQPSVVVQQLLPIFRLSAPYGVYSVAGTDDFRFKMDMYRDVYDSNRFYILSNNIVTTQYKGHNINVIGVADENASLSFSDPSNDLIRDTLRAIDDEDRALNILLSNSPRYTDDYLNESKDFNLMFAGNTYGGMTFFFKPFFALFNRGYVQGLYHLGDNINLYVSSGTNMTALAPLRMGSISEITYMVIHSNEVQHTPEEERRFLLNSGGLIDSLL